MTEETKATTTSTIMDKVEDENGLDTEEPRKEEKLTSIMEAANALTALGDEDDVPVEVAAPDSATITKNAATINDDADDKHPSVDNTTEVNPSSNDAAVLVTTDEQQEAPSPSTPVVAPAAATPTTAPTVQQPSGDGCDTVTSEKSGGTNGGSHSNTSKRFLPEHKKPDAAPTFPEKMMALMRSVDEHKDDPNYCAAWLPEGKSFVVRNPDEFARQVVPKFFKATKFSSFTRKLYRWGFRQINRGIGPDDPVIFGNEFFERDNEALMSQMRSITAASARKAESRMIGAASHQHNMYGKRPFDGGSPPSSSMYDTYAEQQKRYLYEQFMHQQKNAQMMQQQHSPTLYGGMSTNSPMHMNHHPMNGGGGGGNPMMDSGYPPSHHMLPSMSSSKPYDMMHSMHSDGSSQPMMMNMGYNSMHQQHLQQQQSQSQPISLQHQQGGGAMNIGTSTSGMSGSLSQQHHMGQSMTGPNSMMSNLPPQHQGSNTGGGSVGPSQGGYGGGGGGGASSGASSGNTGNQNTTEIVNAAIRALHYSA